MAQHLDACNDAILTEGKTANAMVAGRAQGPRALTALHGGRILGVVITGHCWVSRVGCQCCCLLLAASILLSSVARFAGFDFFGPLSRVSRYALYA